jgi:hypothetical protein
MEVIYLRETTWDLCRSAVPNAGQMELVHVAPKALFKKRYTADIPRQCCPSQGLVSKFTPAYSYCRESYKFAGSERLQSLIDLITSGIPHARFHGRSMFSLAKQYQLEIGDESTIVTWRTDSHQQFLQYLGCFPRAQ